MRFSSPIVEDFYKKKFLAKAVRRTAIHKWLSKNQGNERIVTVVRYNGVDYTEMKASIKDIFILMKDAGLLAFKKDGSIKPEGPLTGYGVSWWILP